MKFSVKYLSQFVDRLPIDVSLISAQLINLGIELEHIITDPFDNNILEVSVAPNRADLLSIVGIARELALINNTNLKLPDLKNNIIVDVDVDAIKNLPEIHVNILAPAACPKYSIRVIRNINTNATTPNWMAEVLNNAGISLISPIVDITNYVMFELGQPLHAFDLNKISNNADNNKEIIVRNALNAEELILLNKNKINLRAEDLVIADYKKPLAIAGIMGGLDSSITADTKDIILECAYFEPIAIRMTSAKHNITSDSAQRFTRNIDPNLQDLAMLRVSNLLKEIVGGEFSAVTTIVNKQHLPILATINLNKDKIKQVLGIYPAEQKIIDILQSLGMTTVKTYSGWKVEVPSWRQDLKIQEDLIEEIARFIGYNNVEPQFMNLPLKFKNQSNKLNFSKELQYKNCLANRGYREAINYSFIDADLANKFYPNHKLYELKNPISKNMNVMRAGLWPGLVTSLIHNQNRQQTRVRLFELGTVFFLNTKTDVIEEHKKIAGIISGKFLEENWQNLNKNVDFFTIKSDVVALIELGFNKVEVDVQFVPAKHSALQPANAAIININNIEVGVVGALHPQLLEHLSITEPAFLFELDLASISNMQLPQFVDISKFPAIRRDFSIVVDVFVSCGEIKKVIQSSCSELLKKIIFFDLYSGNKLLDHKKNIAFGVVLQHPNRTLVEQEINDLVANIITNLERVGAHLRT